MDERVAAGVIEALRYVTSRGMVYPELCEVVDASPREVHDALRDLIETKRVISDGTRFDRAGVPLCVWRLRRGGE